MDELRSLISNNKIEEFEKLFMPYLYQTEYFKNHELGFYITDELYTLARKYWKATSRRIYAGEVEELIPQSLKDKDVAAVYSKYNPQPYDEEKWNTLKKMVEDKYMEKELFVLDDDSRVETEE
jgi:hypothetical protein